MECICFEYPVSTSTSDPRLLLLLILAFVFVAFEFKRNRRVTPVCVSLYRSTPARRPISASIMQKLRHRLCELCPTLLVFIIPIVARLSFLSHYSKTDVYFTASISTLHSACEIVMSL